MKQRNSTTQPPIKKNKVQYFEQADKAIPHASDVELLLIGQMLMFPQIRAEMLLIIRPEFFYQPQHKVIISAIDQDFGEGKMSDMYTLHRLISKSSDQVQIDYLQHAIERVASAANAEAHARIITEMYILRKTIEECSAVATECFEKQDPFIVIDRMEKHCSDIKQSLIGSDFEHSPAEYSEAVLNQIMEKKVNGLTGIDTGNGKLNDFIGGWNQPDLIILAGRPGMGKTTRMLEFMKRALLEGKPCVLFSLEMSKEQIYKKLFSNLSKVPSEKFRNNTLTDYDIKCLKEAKDGIGKLPLYINDKGGINLNYIRSICRERKKKHGLAMVFIDYLQIINSIDNTKGKSQEQIIAEISTGLKNLAKDLQIPVMALSQLSREVEKRSDKRPIKSDLRHSGQIEQDADVIFGMYRPSQYGDFEAFSKEFSDPRTFELTSELLILKNRHGESEARLVEYFYGGISRVEPFPFGENGSVDRPAELHVPQVLPF